ncbi:MAG: 30S ribosomal protein S17 [Polyangiaceae bacterium]|jgi:small subunit ribosomal protein S17
MTQKSPASPIDAKGTVPHPTAHGFRRKMVGRVVKAKMQKTVVVEVVTHRPDALYGKYVRSRARYKAHDEKNQFKAGDEVEIQEFRPISRDKRWVVTRLIKKFVEE